MRITRKTTPGLDQATEAFKADWEQRNKVIEENPVTLFLDRHEVAGTPNHLTITGVADVKVTLGDLKAFVRALK